jgi:hypothetical protein
MTNVQNYSSYSAANGNTGAPTLTYDGSGNVTNSWSYDTGSPGDIMVVQLIYQWPIVGGPLGFMLSNLGNNKTEMVGISVFRNEPF